MSMTLKSTIAALLAAAATTALAQEEIKIGACQPITGPFAFAGGQLNAGLGDYIAFANEQGLVKGKKLTYFFEDTGYDTEKSVAAFKKMMAQQNPAIMYGESTGQGKAIAPELNARYKVMYGSTSFSSELANPTTHPYSFVSGPTYSDQFGVLLQYIAGTAKGKKPKVAFFHAPSEFGMDPIAFGKARAAELGIEVVADVVAKVGAVDVTTEVLNLKKVKPDFVIFQGYVMAPIPEVIRAARDQGLKTTFMSTFWSMDKGIIEKLGEDAEGYIGVNPYGYYYEEVPGMAAMRKYNERVHPAEAKYRPNSYIQGWFTGMVFVESIRRVVAAGKPVNGDNLMAALATIKDWDTGGVTGKVTFLNNKTGIGRVYRANVAKGIFEPASDWIQVK
jgi:branched-chain amino acid transport system substrate-binding protein